MDTYATISEKSEIELLSQYFLSFLDEFGMPTVCYTRPTKMSNITDYKSIPNNTAH